jgi:hypothetical protein
MPADWNDVTLWEWFQSADLWSAFHLVTRCSINKQHKCVYTVEPGYNDIGLYDTSVIKTLVYNDTKYSVPFTTL